MFLNLVYLLNVDTIRGSQLICFGAFLLSFIAKCGLCKKNKYSNLFLKVIL